MASPSSDVIVLAIGIVVAAVYLFRGSLFSSSETKKTPPVTGKVVQNGTGDPRDFVAKMKAAKKRLVIFYGSQTGTAEEYAIRLAKEAKSRFGLASLVCDPEEYDFENLDQVPEDCAVIFVMATYGEGEPTDNAVQLMQNLTEADFTFSKGEHRLDGLHYVMFGLGNRTYEHYNEIARKLDTALTEAGAKRIGERGEGDDDKSMEEDYLEWKEPMWAAFAAEMNVEEGGGGDTPDFAVTELDSHPPEKVYLGELSARALTRTRGIHDAKNPYPAPITVSRELFSIGADRNCIHMELNIEGSGINYQHGDHVGVWPSNAELDVERFLCTLGLSSPERRDTVIGIESLDPALAKVPFPVPTTYITVLRHYIDISAVAGRQTLGHLAKYAPTPEAEKFLRDVSTDKEVYANVVGNGCLKLAEVLQLAAGNDITVRPTAENTTVWKIPFDMIVSNIPRLQPRYYSISSSPKLYPTSIHVTAVVLKYQSVENPKVKSRLIYGVGTNFLLNLKHAANGEPISVSLESANLLGGSTPMYAISGPRGAYIEEAIYKVPIHVRRSTFRLPTNPRSPIIMVGPGTGVAPFRGFVQERVALARRTSEKAGKESLADWGRMSLFYGCRKSSEDFLYKDEWQQYADELGDKFSFNIALSREKFKPDGSKIYVQDLMWDDREALADEILNKKAYVYICGDAKGMAHSVEEKLALILGQAKGGTAEKEGMEAVKLLKERSRLMLDDTRNDTRNESHPLTTSTHTAKTRSIDLSYIRQRLHEQAKVLSSAAAIQFSELGGKLNKISGYGHIESLKNQVVENEAAIVAKRQAARNAKIEYNEAVARRSNSQKEVNDLLQRKSTWTETDVSRFTALVRQDHLYEQEETQAKLHVESTEADVEHQFNELMRTILNRYHEEQVWSDKIRSVSTYGSLLALGVNIFIFILAILVVEPWKRKRLAETFEKRIEHLSIENRELIRKGLEDFASHFDKQETVLSKMEQTLEDISIPKFSEDVKPPQHVDIMTKGSLDKEKWFIGLMGAAGGVALTTILTYFTS